MVLSLQLPSNSDPKSSLEDPACRSVHYKPIGLGSKIPVRIENGCASTLRQDGTSDGVESRNDSTSLSETDPSMSRQTKASGTSGVPGATVQQTQLYLEQSKAWMQSKPQGQQILSSTLSSFVTTGTSGSQTPMSQKALQEHDLTQQSRGAARYPGAPTSPYSSASGATPSVAGSSCVGMPPSCSSIPHSLSFSGYSHHSLMQGTSFSSPCPSTFAAVAQPSAAASFFARAAQRLNLSSKKKRRHHHVEAEPPPFLTNFSDMLRLSPPPAPPCLLRSVGRKESFSIGKVKVMLRIRSDSPVRELNPSFLNVDSRKKQITIYDPAQCATPEKRAGVPAPKMFAFDAIFSPDDTQAEVCSGSLPEVIQAVVGGTDGCLFVYGHSKLGKTHTMVGDSESIQDLGVIPCAISWLFRLIYEQKQKTGARFSVRVSALELTGRNENLRDLLSEYAAGTEGSGTSPAVYLREDPIFGAQLINQSELRAPTAEKAGYLLDAALAARSRDTDDEGRNSHFVFTLHLYQYRVEKGGKGGVAGGRSRLHLFDLGSCDKITSKPRDGGSLSLSALGNVILALFNGQKHVPYKESKLTQLLKEAMSSLTCRVSMIGHISAQPSHYSEILGTIQLASRVHRMRRKKIKYPNVPMEDDKGAVRPYVRMHAEDNVKSGSSDPDYTSSSEQSCDTVIYVGNLGHRERDFTDNEGPPPCLPIVPKASKPPPQSKPVPAQEPSGTPERKRHNSFSKMLATSDEKKQEDKSIGAEQSSPSAKLQGKIQASVKNPLRNLPASTQTLGTESPTHAVKSPAKKAKHRIAQGKQDQGTEAKGLKMQSDETWIDGPRFTKPKFDSKTLHQLQKEQWVDGPPNMYGFMDHHKQSMIQRWVEEHSRQLQSSTPTKKKSEVWIDYPPDTAETSKGDKQEKARDKRVTVGQLLKHEPHKGTDAEPEDVTAAEDEADSASNSADVDETDNEENAEANGYDSDFHILQISHHDSQRHTFAGVQRTKCPDGICDDNRHVELIEVLEPEEPVPMVDSCLQVTEEDIITEYWLQCRQQLSENPLPEVDQSSCDSREHPLRVLSEEGLNLPSSFTDSRSVSVDLDSISVPDTCRGDLRDKSALTWRLLYGNMFQRIKEQQQQRQRRAADDLTSVANSEINQKLEHIAKLRELIQPLTRHRDQTKVESIFKTCPISRLPNSGSRYTMSEMLCASRDSSMEDLSQADIVSTQSEPPDLDIDKYDHKLSIKPMNGLKLEAFYRKIQKVPPFLDQSLIPKPTQVVPPLSYEQEKKFAEKPNESNQITLDNDENAERQNALTHTYSIPHIHRQPSVTNFQRESAKLSASENSISSKSRTEEVKKEPERSHLPKRSESKSRNGCKIDTQQLTVGQSPSISPKSRLYRGKAKVADVQSVHSQQPSTAMTSSSSLWSKDTSTTSSSTKTPQRTSGRGTKAAAPLNKTGKLPVHSSPTSSSTSGVTTTCCMKQKDKTVPQKCSHSKQQKQQQQGKRSSKSICRSTSSPSTSCVDSGDTAVTDFTDSEHYRHSGAFSSPYHHHKTPHHRSNHHHHHQRTSSGHGSESSVNSVEPREAKEMLLKGPKTQQFSGTSSGYESMLRDSEGTPLSSSQESGNEESVDKDRGRKGRRKSPVSGSSKRSLSAPARSPPSPLGPSPPAISQQPLAGTRGCQQRRGDRSLHRSDDEVCCTSLLCCRLLDFY